MGNLSLEVADQRESMRLKLRDNFRDWSTIFSEAIAQAQAAGELTVKTDAKVLANFILNSWEGALLRMKTERSVKPLNDAKKIIFENILS
jgi:TetR/AcrR family transcriptional regulator, transcriptional repressor for nem operon